MVPKTSIFRPVFGKQPKLIGKENLQFLASVFLVFLEFLKCFVTFQFQFSKQSLSFLGKTFNTNQFCLCLTRWSNTIKQTDLLAFVFDAIATISKASFSCIIIRQGKKLFSSFPIFGKKSMRQMHLHSPELVLLANSVHSSFTHNANAS